MKIFVTGGTGFIGRVAVGLLEGRGHELLLLVRDAGRAVDVLGESFAGEFVEGDLSSVGSWKSKLGEWGADAVLHLAWEGLPDYSKEVCERNVKYGRELFLAAAQAGCKCILATGSCWEYKGRQGVLDEESELDLSGAFGACKNSLRLSGEEICREYGVRFYWPRLFYVYGPEQRKTSLIPYIISSLHDEFVPEIRNLNNKHDFVYVDDVAKAIVMIIEKQPDKMVYNIGSGYSTSVRDVVSIVSEIMQCQQLYSQMNDMLLQQAGEDFWADISRARDDLAWSPAYSMRDGIQALLAFSCKAR